MKPGVRTSEFWVTVLTAVLAFVSGLSSAMGWAFTGDNLAPLVPTAAALIAGAVAHGYVTGRSNVKAKTATSAATVARMSALTAASTPTVLFPPVPVAPDVPPPTVGTLA